MVMSRITNTLLFLYCFIPFLPISVAFEFVDLMPMNSYINDFQVQLLGCYTQLSNIIDYMEYECTIWPQVCLSFSWIYDCWLVKPLTMHLFVCIHNYFLVPRHWRFLSTAEKVSYYLFIWRMHDTKTVLGLGARDKLLSFIL